MNKSLIQKRTKSGPEGAQTLVQKERKGPAGPEKSGINMEQDWTNTTKVRYQWEQKVDACCSGIGGIL